jgi:hypothetical protein
VRAVKLSKTAAIIAATILSISIAHAEDAQPFAGFEGAWAGDGMISLADGSTEKIRCKNQYLVTESGSNLQQALRCASDSYQFQVNTFVDVDGSGALSGNWTEVTRNVSGPVTGSIGAGRVAVSVGSGSHFSATMSIVTNGNRQEVKIEPKGTDVKLVAISLDKAL